MFSSFLLPRTEENLTEISENLQNSKPGTAVHGLLSMVEAKFRGVQQRPQDIAHKLIASRARCLQVLRDGPALSRRGSALEDCEIGVPRKLLGVVGFDKTGRALCIALADSYSFRNFGEFMILARVKSSIRSHLSSSASSLPASLLSPVLVRVRHPLAGRLPVLVP
jgi:hypothetical protein